MFDPFVGRRSLTPAQWKARGEAIQARLQGLSIDELMRGGRGAEAPHIGAHGQRPGGYDPNQPRVPAGHSDGLRIGFMKKSTYFDTYVGPGWPDPNWLAPYFLTDSGRRAAFDDDTDSWALRIDGLQGTDQLPQFNGRIDLVLTIIGSIDHGVLLCHQKWGPNGIGHYSIADRRRLHEWLETKHGDLKPVGLFIPFEAAWRAVKEFIEKDGVLPKSIPWIAVSDIPPGAFPGPFEHRT